MILPKKIDMKLKSKMSIAVTAIFFVSISALYLFFVFYQEQVLEKRELFFLVILLLLLFYVLFQLSFSHLVIGPLERLYRGIKLVKKGDELHINTHDEIGEISRAFNEMTSYLEFSRDEVRDQVKKQTRHLADQKRKLQASQEKATLILKDLEKEKEHVIKERDKTDAILYSIADGVFVIDRNLKVIRLNQAAVDISGFPQKDVIGKIYSEVFKIVFEKTKKKNDRFIIEAMETGKTQRVIDDSMIVSKDGSHIPVSTSAAPLKDSKGDVVGCVVVFRDITREKEVDQMKADFISIASHQLKTPLTAVRWYMEMILRDKTLSSSQRELIRESYAGAKRMSRIVNDLLNVSRLENGRIRIEPELIQPETFIADVISYATPLLEEYSGVIKFKTFSKKLPKIPIDPGMLGQVLQNLLTNAILYTPKDKKCFVTVGLSQKGRKCIISIKDNGIGVDERSKNRIFDKFFRSDDAQIQDTTGSGLGLYIAKKIMTASGGDIWFDSKKGKGATFYISLPIKGMKTVKGDKGLA